MVNNGRKSGQRPCQPLITAAKPPRLSELLSTLLGILLLLSFCLHHRDNLLSSQSKSSAAQGPRSHLHEAVLRWSGLGLASAEAFGRLLEKPQERGVE